MKPLPLAAAAIGGMSPYFVKLAKNLLAAGPTQHISDLVSPAFFLGLAFIAIIGALVSLILQESDIKKAFVLGISGPALISTTLSTAENAGKGFTLSIPSPIETAFAQTSQTLREPDAGPSSGRIIEVFNLRSSFPLTVAFFGANDIKLMESGIKADGFAQILVPDSAQRVQFQVEQDRTREYDLPTTSEEMKSFEVSVSGERQYGFLQALGQPAPIKYEISVLEELVRKASTGQEGWAYAGVFQNGNWSTEYNTQYLSTPSHELPQVGSELTVLFPVNIRSKPSQSGKPLGQLRINQKIEVKDIQDDQGSGRVWLQVRVAE